MRGSTGPLDHGHAVCGAQAVGNFAEGRRFTRYVLYRFPEDVRHRRPHSPLAGTYLHRSITADDSSHLYIPHYYGMRARVRPGDSVCLDFFKGVKGLR